MALETILGTVVLPAALDLLKGMGSAVSRKWFGLSVDDQIKIDNASVEKLKAISALDNPYGTPSQWVVDLRASFRYIAAGVLILGGLAITGIGAYQYLYAATTDAQDLAKGILSVGLETAGTPFFFVFGERMWQGIRGMLK